MAAQLVLQAHIDTNRDTFLDLGPTTGKKRPAIIEEPPFEPNSKLEGEKIVFTGKLPVSRNSAQNMVIQSGGSVVKSVTKKTTILVCGKQDKDSLKGKTISNKHLKVRERIRTGQKIEVLSGEDFLGLFYGHEEIPRLGYGTGDLDRDTRFEMYLDSDGLWRWTLHHKRLVLAVSDRGYKTKSACKHYIGLTKYAATNIRIEEH